MKVEDFMNTIFPPGLLRDEMPVVAWADTFNGRDYMAQRGWPTKEKATYFCVSTVQPQRRRQVRKRREDVRSMWALVCDDIGTKSELGVPPSYLLETSAGNYQAGYLIEPFDDAPYFDSALAALAEAGYNDPGCRGANRLMRLPGAVHHTGFVARIEAWEPQRVWELPKLVAEFGVEVKPARGRAVRPGKWDRLEDVKDPLYDALVRQGKVLGHNDTWVFIECPWREEHTDGAQGTTSTAYSPRDYGRAGIDFKCLHGHCAERSKFQLILEILGAKE